MSIVRRAVLTAATLTVSLGALTGCASSDPAPNPTATEFGCSAAGAAYEATTVELDEQAKRNLTAAGCTPEQIDDINAKIRERLQQLGNPGAATPGQP